MISLVAGVLAISACASTEKAPVEAEAVHEGVNAPAQLVRYAAGSSWQWVEKGGREINATIVAVDGDNYQYALDNGCTFTRDITLFAPETKWRNCATSGALEIVKTEGQIWPLAIGNKQSWIMKDESGRDLGARSCVVNDRKNVSVPAGEFDAFEVVCEGRGHSKTSYYAPAMKSVISSVTHVLGSTKVGPELVSAALIEAQ